MKEGARGRLNEFVARLFLNSRFDVLLILVLITLSVGTVFYSKVEGWSVLDSLYFSVITLSTVGYGDLSPVTSFGKFFTIFYIIAGIGILLGLINFITDEALRYKIRGKSEKKVREEAVNVIKERKAEKRELAKRKKRKKLF
jgi:voltage-gated potassium channel